jgi:fumarate reductase iron-sulfur subunit
MSESFADVSDLTVPEPEPAGILRVDVWRGAASGRFQSFAVPRRANQTVLDVVTEIQREQDPTLSYRFACRVGMCGSCAMVVNGRPRWTCRTRIAQVVKAGGLLKLEPLRNFTVVKDLAVDMAEFFAKWRAAKG